METSIRTLVVEDEKRIADFLSRGLESAGYSVELAYDGQSALDLIHAADYDLIFWIWVCPTWMGSRFWSASATAKLPRRS